MSQNVVMNCGILLCLWLMKLNFNYILPFIVIYSSWNPESWLADYRFTMYNSKLFTEGISCNISSALARTISSHKISATTHITYKIYLYKITTSFALKSACEAILVLLHIELNGQFCLSSQNLCPNIIVI